MKYTITPSSGVTLQTYSFAKIGHLCIFTFVFRCPNISAGGTIVTMPFESSVTTYNKVHDNDGVIGYLKVDGNKLITDVSKTPNGLVIGEIVYVTNS